MFESREIDMLLFWTLCMIEYESLAALPPQLQTAITNLSLPPSSPAHHFFTASLISLISQLDFDYDVFHLFISPAFPPELVGKKGHGSFSPH